MEDTETKKKPYVKLSGQDGNAFNVMGLASRALKRAGYTDEEIKQYTDEAMSGDYNNLLRVTAKWCNVQ